MKNKIAIMAIAALSIGSCKKSYLDTVPTNRVGTDGAFSDANNVYSLLAGIDQSLNQRYNTNVPFGWGMKHINMANDIMGNDMVGTGSNYDWFQSYYNFVQTRSSNSWAVFIPWNYMYKQINACNEVLDVIDAASGPESVKNDIKGQALAYRAYFYHNLATLYCKPYNKGANAGAQGLPISTLPVSKQGIDGIKRHTLGEVWDRIKADIDQAVTLLSNTTVTRKNKSQINYNVACGIAARIALELGENEKAIDLATKAATGHPLMTATEVLQGFNDRNIGEFMWCSTLNNEQYDDQGIQSFISFMYDGIYSYARDGNARRGITTTLLNKIPATDVRRQWFEWNASTSMNVQQKFKSKGGDNYQHDAVLMRSAEMYLIIAEAYNAMGNRDKSIENLDIINAARNTAPFTYPTTNTAFTRTLKELRRIELWGEGFAFGDLKRWGDPLNRPTANPGDHQTSVAGVVNLAPDDVRWLYLLPQSEIDNNKAMSAADQNP